MKVCVIGGGAAGYLSALAYHRKVGAEVTVYVSEKIPPIGVGESTTPRFLAFLHHYLGVDINEFFHECCPTVKLGLRFEWGGKDHFNYIYSQKGSEEFKEVQNFGLAEVLDMTGSIRDSSLASILMDECKLPIVRDRWGKMVSLMNQYRFSWHIDTSKFIHYLKSLCERDGIRIVNEHAEIAYDEAGDISCISSATTHTRHDLYVDATGFTRAVRPNDPVVDFRSSLFNDRCITAKGYEGESFPYTRCTAMNNGWTWSIPLQKGWVHYGYVYSSRFTDDESAARELQNWLGPRAGNQELCDFLKFPSFRRESFWKGNVIHIGNSYGFVEPIESTGLMMISFGLFVATKLCTQSGFGRNICNSMMSRAWDNIRWFVTAHFKFNSAINNPYWGACRREADISGFSDLLELYKERGPLQDHEYIRTDEIIDSVFGMYGIDTILMGQEVRPPKPDYDPRVIQNYISKAKFISANCMSHDRAIKYMRNNPEVLQSASDNWIKDLIFERVG